jgi:uncharacterized alkaline shock family protein YloU
MELLVIFTSEEEGADEIMKILSDNSVQRGVVIESQGMRKVLGIHFSADKIFGIFGDRRPFNKTLMAVIEKENARKVIDSINNFWKPGRDKGKKKNRVMFSTPINNLAIGV